MYTIEQYLKAQNRNALSMSKPPTNGTVSNASPDDNSVKHEEVKESENENENESLFYSVPLTEDAVIQNLDRILLKEEEQIQQSACLNGFDRKVSVDTASIHSRIFYEENVTALIHREDRCSITAPYLDATYPIPEESFDSLPTNNDIDVNLDKPLTGERVEHNEDVTELVETLNDDINAPTLPMTIQLREALNDGLPMRPNQELIIIPAPPSLRDFEMYKRSTMPAIKIRTKSRKETPFQIVHSHDDDEYEENDSNDEDVEEHVLTSQSKKYKRFKQQLEKIIRSPTAMNFTHNVKTTKKKKIDELAADRNRKNSVEDCQEFEPKVNFKEKLENLYMNRIKRSKSHNDIEMQTPNNSVVNAESRDSGIEDQEAATEDRSVSNNSLDIQAIGTRNKLNKELANLFHTNENTLNVSNAENQT